MVFEAYDPNTALGGDAVVIDNSIAMRWLVATTRHKDQSYALSVREAVRHRSLRVVVPYTWVYEAAHVVAAYIARGDVTHQQGTRLLHALEDVFTVVVGQESATELAEFAGAHRLSGYDAAYVMLAERQNAPLATLDQDMKRVAKTLGVSLFQEYTPDSV